MAKKMGFDFSRVKTFLLEKGERVALFACGGIALLLVVFNLLGAMGAAKPEKSNKSSWADAIDEKTKELESKVAAARSDTEPPPPDGEGKPSPPPKAEPLAFLRPEFWPNPWIVLADQVDTKRRRPPVLTPRPERIDIQYLQGGYFSYRILPGQKVAVFTGGVVGGDVGGMPPAVPPVRPGGMPPEMGGPGAAAENPVKQFKAARMVMVSLVFPMKEQIEVYKNALRFSSVEELLTKPDLLPRATGLVVMRSERQADGSWSKAVPVYNANAKGEASIGAGFDQTLKMLQFGMFDQNEPGIYAKHVVGGLMTPLPLLANLETPIIRLDGIEANEAAKKGPVVADGGMPPGGGGAVLPPMGDKGSGRPLPGGGGPLPGGGKDTPGGTGNPLETKPVDWDKFPKEKPRWSGKVFNPFPKKEDLFGAAGAADPMNPMPAVPVDPRIKPPMGDPMGDPMGGDPLGFPGSFPPDDALIRFIDADVYPGKSYAYWVQVRMANPNFGTKYEKDVAFKELTKDVELKGPFWQVPQVVTVPHDLNIYAVDETPHREIKGGADMPRSFSLGKDGMAFQVHRWVEQTSDAGSRPLGDWAIAERLVIRKGEFIGRPSVKVEVPEWAENYNMFRVEVRVSKAKATKQKGEVLGIPIDFSGDFSLTPSTPARFALVDFAGGMMPVRPGIGREEGNLQALILTPDGRLTVLNSREDVPNQTRIKRVQNWRKRVEDTLKMQDPGGGFGGGEGMPPGAGGMP